MNNRSTKLYFIASVMKDLFRNLYTFLTMFCRNVICSVVCGLRGVLFLQQKALATGGCKLLGVECIFKKFAILKSTSLRFGDVRRV
jgi:hypothetical protein